MELKQAKAKAKDIVDAMKIKVIELTDKAKEKAKLCIDKAKEKSKKCLDKTKAKQIIEESKKKAKEILLIAKEKKMLALKKAKIKAQQCIDKSKKQKGGDGGYCEINEYVSFTKEDINKRYKMMEHMLDTSNLKVFDIYQQFRDHVYDIHEPSPEAQIFIKAIIPKIREYSFQINNSINSSIEDKHKVLAEIFNNLYEFLNKNKGLYKYCGILVLILSIAIIEFIIAKYSSDITGSGSSCVGEKWYQAFITKHYTKYNELGMFPKNITFSQILEKINICAALDPDPGEL
jgi:hypothetical protein